MWVDRKEFESLKERVSRIETATAMLQYETQIWVPDAKPLNLYYESCNIAGKVIGLNVCRGREHVLLVDIIRELLEKSGYELKIQPRSTEKEKLLYKQCV